MLKKRLTETLACFILAGILAGCATFSPAKEALEVKPDFNARTYGAPTDTCWSALKQMFLKNNYTISYEDFQSKRMQAVKHFDKGSLSVDLLIQANFEVLENSKTQIYLNAVQNSKTIYTTRKTLLFIPIPGTTQTTQAEKQGTIEDKKFYEAFFNAVEEEIKNSKPK